VVINESDTNLDELFKDGKFERDNDYSSCTYFYLATPENKLLPFDPVAKRIEGL
jgi:hypothetical protein